jgi:hypothetical protein
MRAVAVRGARPGAASTQAELRHELLDGGIVGRAPVRAEKRDLELGLTDLHGDAVRLLLEVIEKQLDELRITHVNAQASPSPEFGVDVLTFAERRLRRTTRRWGQPEPRERLYATYERGRSTRPFSYA